MNKPSGPKILLLDVETAPILAYVWALWDQNVGLNQIKDDTYLLSYAAKWLGDKKIIYSDQRKAKNIENDRALLEEIWGLLDECDVLITQNGKAFDIKRINARLVAHGFIPPSSFKHVDTLQIAKSKFGFTSNKLEYMTNLLCTKYKKLKNSGFELWTRCLGGEKSAWEEMEKYNKHDVLSLEELYIKLRPWDSTYNPNLYTDEETFICVCGGTNIKKNGHDYTSLGKFQRYRCRDCGHPSRSRENLFSKEKRKSLKARN